MSDLLAKVDKTKALKAATAFVSLYVAVRFYRYIQWRNKLLQTFKCPPPSLFLGNVMDFVRAGGFNEQFFAMLHEKYGEFPGFFLLPNLFNLSINHPDGVAELYKKTKSRPLETYMFLNYLGDDNLLFTHGPLVKELRLRYGSMITNQQQLEKLNITSIDAFGKLLDSWENEKEVDVFATIAPVIYDVMGRVLFGSGWLGTDIGKKVYAAHKYLIVNVNKFMIMPWLQPFGYMKYLNTIKVWRKLCNDLLDERAAEIAKNPQEWKDDQSALTMLLTSTNKEGEKFFSRHRAVSTVCGFLNGAYDTTHATCFWLIYNLARNPEVQDKLRSEVNKYVKFNDNNTDGKLFSIEDARKVEYLEAFIRESLRVIPTVPVNQRINYDEDMVILGKYVIPKGTNTNIPMSELFNRKDFFGDDPEKFRPERFLPGDPFCDKGKRAWTAFGGFSRMCIGTVFAFVELKVLLILLVKRFHIKFADENENFTPRMIEAGVNQPEKKLKFKFVPV